MMLREIASPAEPRRCEARGKRAPGAPSGAKPGQVRDFPDIAALQGHASIYGTRYGMRIISRFRGAALIAALALAVAIPGVALGKANHGNHCGKGHAKHGKAIGKSCSKHHPKPTKAERRAA